MKNWVKFWTRNFGLFRYYVYIESNKLEFYKQHFGSVFNDTITVPDGKLMAYYHDKNELDQLTKKIYEVSCTDFKIFETFSQQIFSWMQEFIDYNNKLNPKELATLNAAELKKEFNNWYQKYLHWQIGIYFYFVLEPIVTEKFLSYSEEYFRTKNELSKLNDFTQIVMAPEQMNAVNREQLDAYNTAIKVKENSAKKETLIKRYHQKFSWIPCYDIKDPEQVLSYSEKRINDLLDLNIPVLKEKSWQLKTEFRKRKKIFEKAMSPINDTKLTELSKIMHQLVFYKDHRDDKRREAGLAGKRFMNILAQKLDLTLEEVNYLTPPELLSALSGDLIPKSEIRTRIPANYVLLSTSGKIELFTGEDIKRVLEEQFPKTSDQSNTIKGVIASKGKATGRVVIVRHTISLKKVQPSDILVAVTTHPDYVMAMEKCKAIVTDEGGMTSHAAIVSRELGIPCIVGTKIATKVLKDGDLIEVDAERGVITKK